MYTIDNTCCDCVANTAEKAPDTFLFSLVGVVLMTIALLFIGLIFLEKWKIRHNIEDPYKPPIKYSRCKYVLIAAFAIIAVCFWFVIGSTVIDHNPWFSLNYAPQTAEILIDRGISMLIIIVMILVLRGCQLRRNQKKK